MSITITKFDDLEHSMTFNLGTGIEVKARHLSDADLNDLRAASAGSENANDTTGLPIDSSL